ncbi:MAG: hypothetical protein ACKOV8_11560, partial [Phycisphaerales bacterium]
MKLLASLRSLLAPVDQPLALLGPGGDFVDALVERNGRRIRELLAPSRARVGQFLGRRPGGFGFVTN